MKRTPLKRKTPLRSRGRKADREKPALDAFREALRARSGGLCEVRTPACPLGPHFGCDPHHRCHADRDRGVHDPERGLWVCRVGHDWIETHPAESYRAGWLIRGEAA